jgi:hypothetical protein
MNYMTTITNDHSKSSYYGPLISSNNPTQIQRESNLATAIPIEAFRWECHRSLPTDGMNENLVMYFRKLHDEDHLRFRAEIHDKA